MLRNFVWRIPADTREGVISEPQFKRGKGNCALELFIVFLSNMSDEFKSIICCFPSEIVRSFMCSKNNENHARMEFRTFPAILDVNDRMRDAFSVEKSFLNEKELAEEFNSIFLYQTIIRDREKHNRP